MHEQMKHAQTLIAKAAATEDSGDAMRFSQAANNAANALLSLQTFDQQQDSDSDAGVWTTTDDQVKRIVDRFLGWRLPENFSPDGGISFKKTFNEHTAHPMKNEPIGTNLFGATQATAMVRYMLGDDRA